MLINDLFLILRDLCKCNLTRSDLSNTSVKCKDDSSVRAFINTTLTYSSDTGDEIARTIAQKLYAETLVSSNGLKIGDNILIETVIFVNDSIQSPQNSPGKSLPTIGVAIGSFTGGAVLAVICLGIIFISYCVRYVLVVRILKKYNIAGWSTNFTNCLGFFVLFFLNSWENA